MLLSALAASTVIVADVVGSHVTQPEARQQPTLVQAAPRATDVSAPACAPSRADCSRPAARRCGAIRSAEVAAPCPRTDATKRPAPAAAAPAPAPAAPPTAPLTPVDVAPAPAKATTPSQASPAPKSSAER